MFFQVSRLQHTLCFVISFCRVFSSAYYLTKTQNASFHNVYPPIFRLFCLSVAAGGRPVAHTSRAEAINRPNSKLVSLVMHCRLTDETGFGQCIVIICRTVTADRLLAIFCGAMNLKELKIIHKVSGRHLLENNG